MLTDQELEHAIRVLGREPMETELGMLDVLWSEHCSYKSSKRWFYLFNTEGDHVRLGIGEGAGLVDIGDGYLLGVAMESHNHPSQIDPYNGAATGVGGIIRDVISQGCKAAGLMNCLRFGKPDNPRNAYLLEHVVRGISEYGNSVGIPMVGGELEFDDSYDDNCLVNVVCVGHIKPEHIVRSSARTPGHKLIMFGSTTGRDGIAGVSFASETFSDEEDEKRSAVQIGDPLSKKIVIDVLKELIERKLIDGLQDFGGGGMTSAAGELAERGGTGVEIHVERVPLRESDMKSHEIVISESQERMLAIVTPENVDSVIEVLERNNTPYGIIGEVTDDKYYTVFENGELKARLPINLLVDGFPDPERNVGSLPICDSGQSWYKEPLDYESVIIRLLGSLNICDKSWVYSQYDQHVQSSTVVDIGENAGILEFPNGRKIAFTSDCNSFWCKLDPYHGTANSAAESLRNLVSMGARPILIADCLNFGNPERPDSYAQFVESVKGLGQFSHDFKVPIVGGNVSLYNETEIEGVAHRINPTPQIMIAGLLDRDAQPVRRRLRSPGASIFIVGNTHSELNGTEFQLMTLGVVEGVPPIYQPEKELNAMMCLLMANQLNLIASCNNIGRGGVSIALMKMILKGDCGFSVNLDPALSESLSLGELLFSESSARYIVEVDKENIPGFTRIVKECETPIFMIGETTHEQIADFGTFSVNLDRARLEFETGLTRYMEGA